LTYFKEIKPYTPLCRHFGVFEGAEKKGEAVLCLDGVTVTVTADATGPDVSDFLFRGVLNVCKNFKNLKIFCREKPDLNAGYMERFGFTKIEGGFVAAAENIILSRCGAYETRGDPKNDR
jgi:hypothetical protein